VQCGGGLSVAAVGPGAAADAGNSQQIQGGCASVAEPPPDAAAAATANHMLFGSSRGLERRTAVEANMAAAFTTAWTCHMLELASDLQVSHGGGYSMRLVVQRLAVVVHVMPCGPMQTSGCSCACRASLTLADLFLTATAVTPFPSCLSVCPQYLVVCVPNAFASNLETWFGRIIDSRGHGSDGSSSSSNIIAPLTGSLASGLAGSSSGGDKRSESSWDSSMYMKRLGQVLDTLQVRLTPPLTVC
jgi:hypothetical protein